jgi:hypothetical protein
MFGGVSPFLCILMVQRLCILMVQRAFANCSFCLFEDCLLPSPMNKIKGATRVQEAAPLLVTVGIVGAVAAWSEDAGHGRI